MKSFFEEFKAINDMEMEVVKKTGSITLANLVTGDYKAIALAQIDNDVEINTALKACELIFESIDLDMTRNDKRVYGSYFIVNDTKDGKPMLALFLYGEDIDDSCLGMLSRKISTLGDCEDIEFSINRWDWMYTNSNQLESIL